MSLSWSNLLDWEATDWKHQTVENRRSRAGKRREVRLHFIDPQEISTVGAIRLIVGRKELRLLAQLRCRQQQTDFVFLFADIAWDLIRCQTFDYSSMFTEVTSWIIESFSALRSLTESRGVEANAHNHGEVILSLSFSFRWQSRPISRKQPDQRIESVSFYWLYFVDCNQQGIAN